MSTDSTEPRGEIETALTDTFRKALMVEHHHDWTMETCSEAAHICAGALCDRLTDRVARAAFLKDFFRLTPPGAPSD